MASEGRYDVIFGAKVAQLVAGARTATHHLNGVGTAAMRAMQRYVLPLVGFAGMGQLVRQTLQWADSLGDLSTRTGLTVEQLQDLQYAATLTGGSLENYLGVLYKIQITSQAALAGNVKLIEAYARLRVGWLELGALSPWEKWHLMSEALRDAGGAGKEAAAYFDIVGREAKKSMGIMMEGLDQLAARRKQAGIGITDEDQRRLERANDLLEEFGMKTQTWGAGLVLWLGKAIGKLAQYELQLEQLAFIGPETPESEVAKRYERMKMAAAAHELIWDWVARPREGAGGLTGFRAPTLEEQERKAYLNILPEAITAYKEADFKTMKEHLKQISDNTGETASALKEGEF